MIAHVVTITWKGGTHPDVAGLVAALEVAAGAIPGVAFYRSGPNLGLRANGADYAVIAVAHDLAGLEAYLDSPRHLEIVAQRMAPHIETRQAVQLELGSDLPQEWLA
jgi:Stress responsive A/B Barrel Domain